MAAVVAVLGLAFMGRPLLAGGAPVAEPLILSASAGLVAGAPPTAVANADLPPAEPTAIAAPVASAASADPMAWFVAGGGNQGTENLALALAAIALQGNEPLYISDGWGRTWGGTVSDHYVGNTDAWAVDLAVRGIQRPTPQTEEAARRVGAALGHPGWTGGDLKVTIQGYRFQVLWKVAGHFNHVHVGVKKA